MKNQHKQSISNLLKVPQNISPDMRRVYLIGLYGWPVFLVNHFIFFVLFTILNIWSLSVLNFLSVIVYIINIILHRKNYYHFPITLSYIEMNVFVIISVYFLGWSSGFQLWIFTHTMPIFLAYKWKGWVKVILVGFSCAVFVILYNLVRPVGGINELKSSLNIVLFNINAIAVIISISVGVYFFNNSAEVAEKALIKEHMKTDRLLLNILPESIADRLKRNTGITADRFDNCSILFADIVGFSHLSETMSADNLVRMLNEIFSSFDDLSDSLKLEKIKTIGDAYMVVSGLPEPNDNHAHIITEFAFGMLDILKQHNEKYNQKLNLRIGINSGTVVAGVIGKKKFTYDLWGDAVNIASRMESHGIPSEIHITENTRSIILDDYIIEERGDIEVKSKGKMKTYLVKCKNKKT